MMAKKEAVAKAKLGLIFILISALLSLYVLAIPSQPQLTHISNETSTGSGIGQARSGDPGGYIITLTLNATQQNYKWKAYVGNVTGALVLKDQDSYSIYEWTVGGNAVGNVYIARNGTVNWAGGVNCSNNTEILSEDTFLNLDSSTANSINKTFSSQIHKTFTVSGVDYLNSTCFAISTYINGSSQTADENASFQEIALNDNSGNFIYMTIIEQNVVGFDNSNYDFQALVAEDEALQAGTTYYFYVEIA